MFPYTLFLGTICSFFIIYFYICGVNTESVKDMQTLLNDIELDIQELKCLIQAVSSDANPALRGVVKRNIRQMKARLDVLQELLDEPCDAEAPEVPKPEVRPSEMKQPETQAAEVQKTEMPLPEVRPVAPQPAIVEPKSPEVLPEPEPVAVPPASSILAERIKPAADLRRAISLNDLFRFSRELFGGDTARLNEVVERLGNAPSLDEAMTILTSEIHLSEENEAAADFVELLRKYFS